MRKPEEIQQLNKLKKQSIVKPVDWTNEKGERFIFEQGDLVGYTDQRVISHEGNNLVNLAEKPYID